MKREREEQIREKLSKLQFLLSMMNDAFRKEQTGPCVENREEAEQVRKA
jgi:hypothetical protein